MTCLMNNSNVFRRKKKKYIFCPVTSRLVRSCPEGLATSPTRHSELNYSDLSLGPIVLINAPTLFNRPYQHISDDNKILRRRAP